MGKAVIWANKTKAQKRSILDQNKEARKVRAIKIRNMFGGRCIICGYCKCYAALEFHHIDKATKKFCLSVLHMTKRWSSIVEEAKKCILLCSNCHREVGAGLMSEEFIKSLRVTHVEG